MRAVKIAWWFLTAMALVLGGLVYLSYHSSPIQMQVTGLSWWRATVIGKGCSWKDVPEHKQGFTYEQFGKRIDEPGYDTYHRVYSCTQTRDVQTSAFDQAPYDTDLTLQADEVVIGRYQDLIVHLKTTDGKPFMTHVDNAKLWYSLGLGQKVIGYVNGFGRLSDWTP